jgi:sigma-B regulation protein RsbU (phosphoserine phosphatase)
VALGMMENAGMNQRTISLEIGDSLLFYTDGLTEAFSPAGELFGEGRLLDALQSAQTASADVMLDLIESRLNEFADAIPPSDDLTMLLVKRA